MVKLRIMLSLCRKFNDKQESDIKYSWCHRNSTKTSGLGFRWTQV